MLLEHLLTPAQAYKIHTIVQSGVKIIAPSWILKIVVHGSNAHLVIILGGSQGGTCLILSFQQKEKGGKGRKISKRKENIRFFLDATNWKQFFRGVFAMCRFDFYQ
jgi:hypothetical protein